MKIIQSVNLTEILDLTLQLYFRKVTRSQSHGEKILMARIPADGRDVAGHVIADGAILFEFAQQRGCMDYEQSSS